MPKTTIKAVLGVTIIAAALSLSACSSVKKELGVGRNSPDEFLVVKRAPLTVPPDYVLRPPAEAVAVAAEQQNNTVKTSLLGKSEKSVETGEADKALLGKLGTAEAAPGIREKIEEDNGYISFNNRTLASRLIFWDDEKKTFADAENIPASVVDPAAEAERIKKARAEGKPLTGDKVPVIEKKQSTFDKLF